MSYVLGLCLCVRCCFTIYSVVINLGFYVLISVSLLIPHAIIRLYLYPGQVSKDDVTGILVVALHNRYCCFAIVAKAVVGIFIVFLLFYFLQVFHTHSWNNWDVTLFIIFYLHALVVRF